MSIAVSQSSGRRQLYPLAIVWLWARNLVSLCLPLFTRKRGIKYLPMRRLWEWERTYVKHLVWWVTQQTWIDGGWSGHSSVDEHDDEPDTQVFDLRGLAWVPFSLLCTLNGGTYLLVDLQLFRNLPLMNKFYRKKRVNISAGDEGFPKMPPHANIGAGWRIDLDLHWVVV